jgi:hypothetical protein
VREVVVVDDGDREQSIRHRRTAATAPDQARSRWVVGGGAPLR